MDINCNNIEKYGIPTHGKCMGEHIWNADDTVSKYFNLTQDAQIGVRTEGIEQLRNDYLNEVCNGQKW